MNHWPFIVASYVLTILAAFGLGGWSWAAMRRAERDAERIGRER